MILRLEAPKALAASANSCSLSDSTIPRISRAVVNQPKDMSTMMTITTCCASRGAMYIRAERPFSTNSGTGINSGDWIRIEDRINRIGSVGIVSRNSTIRIPASSTQPLKYPDMAPKKTPMSDEPKTDAIATGKTPQEHLPLFLLLGQRFGGHQ